MQPLAVQSGTDITAQLSAAVKSGGFPTVQPVLLPQGRFIVSKPQFLGQGCVPTGVASAQGGTELVYVGPAGTSLFSPLAMQQSGCGLQSLRVTDSRPGNDWLLNWQQVRNDLTMEDVTFNGKPGWNCLITAAAGTATDVITLRKIWMNSGGLSISRAMKKVRISDFYCDTYTADHVITISAIAPDTCWIEIDSFAHEVHAPGASFLSLPTNTYGNVTLSNGGQITPLGYGTDLVLMGNSINPRLVLENVGGSMHNGPSGVGVVYQADKKLRTYGPILTQWAVH